MERIRANRSVIYMLILRKGKSTLKATRIISTKFYLGDFDTKD